MINISKYTSKDNPPWLPVQPAWTAAAAGAPARTAARGRPPGGRIARIDGDGRIPAVLAVLAAIGAGVLSWLAATPRRLGDRLFAMNDTEAYWRSWQITRTHGGLGRIYRDPQFDTLGEVS